MRGLENTLEQILNILLNTLNVLGLIFCFRPGLIFFSDWCGDSPSRANYTSYYMWCSVSWGGGGDRRDGGGYGAGNGPHQSEGCPRTALFRPCVRLVREADPFCALFAFGRVRFWGYFDNSIIWFTRNDTFDEK